MAVQLNAMTSHSSGGQSALSAYYAHLKEDPIVFESIGRNNSENEDINNVFFDSANGQVFAVRAGGAMGVVVKGPTSSQVVS